MGTQERRAREREARRKTVLDAARVLVRDRGFNGTTTKQIASACELSEATLFFYFKTKDEIFTSLLLEGIDFTGRGIDRIAAAKLGPKAKIRRLWRFFGEVKREHPEYFQVFTYLAHPQATGAVSDELKSELGRRSGDNFRRFSALLDDIVGESQGRVAADLLWSSFVGLMVLRDSRANLGARAHPTDREMTAALELLMRGLLPESASGDPDNPSGDADSPPGDEEGSA